jgi:hypothetical protein
VLAGLVSTIACHRGEPEQGASLERQRRHQLDERGWRPIATGSGRWQRPTAEGRAVATRDDEQCLGPAHL